MLSQKSDDKTIIKDIRMESATTTLLDNFSSCVKEKVLAYNISERHTKELLSIQEEKMQLKIIKSIYRKSLSVQETRDLVEYYNSQKINNCTDAKTTL